MKNNAEASALRWVPLLLTVNWTAYFQAAGEAKRRYY
jgi:hypothetical protein